MLIMSGSWFCISMQFIIEYDQCWTSISCWATKGKMQNITEMHEDIPFTNVNKSLYVIQFELIFSSFLVLFYKILLVYPLVFFGYLLCSRKLFYSTLEVQKTKTNAIIKIPHLTKFIKELYKSVKLFKVFILFSLHIMYNIIFNTLID